MRPNPKVALGSAAALKRFRASPAAGVQAAPAVPPQPPYPHQLTPERTYMPSFSLPIQAFQPGWENTHIRTFRPNAVAMQDQTRLVLLATEGARCTEAAGGQVVAPAPAAPDSLFCRVPHSHVT